MAESQRTTTETAAPGQTKLCIRCRQSKPCGDFGRDRRRTDELFPYCKRCRLKNPTLSDTRREMTARGLRWCSACKAWKPVADFGKNRATRDGLTGQCRPCCREMASVWAKNNREARRAIGNRRKAKRAQEWQSWYARNREEVVRKSWERRQTPEGKAQMAKANAVRRTRNEAVLNDLTAEQWQEILEEQGHLCKLCGRPFSEQLPPTRDHIIPVSRGGGLTRPNTQAACRPCNSRKRDR